MTLPFVADVAPSAVSRPAKRKRPIFAAYCAAHIP